MSFLRETAESDGSCPCGRLIWTQPLEPDSPSLPLRPVSSEESCPVGPSCPLPHLSAFRTELHNPWHLLGSDRDYKTDAETVPHLLRWGSTCSACLLLGRAGQRHPCKAAYFLTQEAVQHLPEEPARWPSEGSDAGLSTLNFSRGLFLNR